MQNKLIPLCVFSLALIGCSPSETPRVASVRYAIDVDGCTVKYIDNPHGNNFYIAKCPAESETVSLFRGKGGAVGSISTTELRQQLMDAEAKEKALSKLTPQEKQLLGINP